MAIKQEVATLFLSLRANAVAWKAGLREAAKATKDFKRSVAVDLTSIRSLVSGAAIAFETRNIVQAGIAFERMGNGMRAATGSAERAKEELAFVRAESGRLGLDLKSSSEAFVQLTAAAKGTASEGKVTRDIFSAISEASIVLGKSADDTEGMLRAIAQMMSKGKVSAEELRGQLGERLPGAFNLAAKAIGVTTAELDDMLKKGEVTTDEMLPGLAREIRNAFGPGVQGAVNSTQANFNRFNTAIFDLRKEFADEFLPSITRFTIYLTNTVIPAFSHWLEKVHLIKREMSSKSEGEQRMRLEELNKGLNYALRDYVKNSRTWSAEAQKDFSKRYAQLSKERDELRKLIAAYDARNEAIVRGRPLPNTDTDAPNTPKPSGGASGEMSKEEKARQKRLLSEYKEGMRLMDQMIREEEKMWRAKDRQRQQADKMFLDDMEEEQRRLDSIAQERESLIAQIRTPIEEYTKSVKEFQDAFRRGLVTQEELGKLVDNARNTYTDSLRGMRDEAQDALEEIRDAIQGIGNELTQAITGYLTGTRGSVRDILKSIEVEITQFAVRQTITDPLVKLMKGAMKGLSAGGGASGGGWLDSLIGKAVGFFGGARAAGGPTTRGKTYLIGEDGPELWTAGANGFVTPNKAIEHGGRPVNVQVSFAEIPRTPAQIQSAGQQAARVGMEVQRALARNT